MVDALTIYAIAIECAAQTSGVPRAFTYYLPVLFSMLSALAPNLARSTPEPAPEPISPRFPGRGAADSLIPSVPAAPVVEGPKPVSDIRRMKFFGHLRSHDEGLRLARFAVTGSPAMAAYDSTFAASPAALIRSRTAPRGTSSSTATPGAELKDSTVSLDLPS